MTLTPEQRVDWDAQSGRIRAGLELIESIPESERNIESDARNDDLLALVNAAVGMIERTGLEEGMDAISISLRVAYALGQRDAQPVPDAFADALDAPASATGGDETEE